MNDDLIKMAMRLAELRGRYAVEARLYLSPDALRLLSEVSALLDSIGCERLAIADVQPTADEYTALNATWNGGAE
jgi:hypothetical protein